MASPHFTMIDGNEAVARVAYRLAEVIAIYPITPASPMGEWADAWAAVGQPNLWGSVPSVVEMQSEAGAAGTVHGALQAGALTTTFTASQGLLLMIPNLYKIAGELTPVVLHIAARSLAAQGLSIFGDHSDVMACRATGCALLCSGSVQEAQDFAAIAQVASLHSRLPFLHFFDGFRTSHEIQKVALLSDDDLRALIPEAAIRAHRARALSPDHPVLRGTAQNPDVYFQARETVNRYYTDAAGLVQVAMDLFAAQTGRQYRLFDYSGAPDAERLVVIMGSGGEVVEETVKAMVARGEKVGCLKVRLYRPFDAAACLAAIPETVCKVAVLDRCKEPGAGGEPLYLDLVEAFARSDRPMPALCGGRYGLSSKEFTPAMVKAVFDHLNAEKPRHPFTVGIRDDVTHLSLDYDAHWGLESERTVRAIFYGLGSDGTVGANKASIKIIGEDTDNWAQGYFVYDSKKSGSVTVSHLRFGPEPIRAPYLIRDAGFIGCHQWEFLERFDVLDAARPGAVLLLNSPYPAEQTWATLPPKVQRRIREKGLDCWVIDAYRLAEDCSLGRHINTPMQVCFFALSGVLPREEAIAAIRQSIRKTYARKGEAVVAANLSVVDRTLEALYPLPIGEVSQETVAYSPMTAAPAFVRDVLGEMLARRGDDLPVSALPCDGTYPTGTAQYEKRNIADEVPVWDPEVCVQCGKCVIACPHAVIRGKVYDPAALTGAPASFLSTHAHDPAFAGQQFTLQVAAEDCTGCGICVEVCPARNKAEPRLKAINMEPQRPRRDAERANWDFFLGLPEIDRSRLNLRKIGQQQLQQPLFEFSGACAGCGETPYLKLASQLFGDRMLVANATGCSSIYGGNLPTTPWSTNAEGRGPAWSNSLFEDNAEFGLGFRVAVDQQAKEAAELLHRLAIARSGGSPIPPDLARAILNAEQRDEPRIFEQRQRVAELKRILADWSDGEEQRAIARLQDLADYLVRKSVWIVGGDGWAYDIGFGGLDHAIASGRDINLLVLDTEVYSNTGGQMSKATPRGAVAKFAAGGKPAPKKDLGWMAMSYGTVYVASVALGARDEHTVRVFLEAESFPGPSLIIAYSHCIAHGIDLRQGMAAQQRAVDSGRWLLYRYDPRRRERGENPLQLDSKPPKLPLEQDLYSQNRFQMLRLSNPDAARELLREAEADVKRRWQLYRYLADRPGEQSRNGHHPPSAPAAATPTTPTPHGG